MSNYTLNNIKRLICHLNEEDFWDMHLNQDDLGEYAFSGIELNEDCLASYIDTDIDECVQDNELISQSSNIWEKACSTGLDLINIGFTGIDNGLFTYKKDRITNQQFYDIFTNSEYKIPSDDLRLHLHTVSGNTLLYEYPLSRNEDGSIKLNGGFYQGFFRSKDNYSILPSSLNNGDTWNLEFVIKKEDYEPESTKTLNDIHPNNKGIFFYIGTRAENKWVELYNKNTIPNGQASQFEEGKQYGYCNQQVDEEDADFADCNHCSIINKDVSGTTSGDSESVSGTTTSGNTYGLVMNAPFDIIDLNDFDEWFLDDNLFNEEDEENQFSGTTSGMPANTESCDYVEEELDLDTVPFKTDNGFDINSANDGYFYSDNKFLMYDRTCDGLRANSAQGNEEVLLAYKKKGFKGNLFLYMNRTPTGYTAQNIDSVIDEDLSTYDYFYKDIYENALAFKVNEDGSVGYRYLIKDCESTNEGHYSVIEDSSYPDMIKNSEWVKINIKIKASEYTMRMYFYVNDKLKYITSELPKLNLHDLFEEDEKTEGVAYNISIGGGTQGLSERILPMYMLNPTKIYPLEENFAGTFIGDFKSFKFYTC